MSNRLERLVAKLPRIGKQLGGLSVILFFAGLLLTSCSQQPSKSDFELETTEFSAFYTYGLPYAKEWDSSAYLARAELPIWEKNDAIAIEVTFSFRAENDRTKWLNMFISPQQGEGFTHEILEGQYENPRPVANPMDPNTIISSKEALMAIMDNGGKEHYSRYHASIDPFLTLQYSDDHFELEPIVWAGHFPSFEPPVALTIQIDAHSGQFIKSIDPLGSD